MEERHVLDDWQEEQTSDKIDQYRRALRFLFYNLGIGVLVAGRIGLLMVQYQNNPERGYAWFTGVPDLVIIGMAVIWLFSGLGLLAIFRARHERPTDLIFALVIVLHLSTFVISSIALYRMFSSPLHLPT